MVDNILRVTFGKETRIKSKPLYQYDYGQKIKFIDLTLPAAYEVHFSNRERGNAQVVLATSNEVVIPDALLQTGLNIFAWVFLHTGNDDGETEYEVTIPVIRRAAALDEEPTEQQASTWDDAIAALNNAVTEARAGVQTVEHIENNVNNVYSLVEADKEIVYRDKEATIAAASFLQNVSANATTLLPDDEATANYSNGIFSFGIPQGIQGEKGDKGDKGDRGDPGEGLPIGGTTNQILVKNSDTYGDCSWQTYTSVFLVTLTMEGSTPVVDKTYDEIINACNSKKIVILNKDNNPYQLESISNDTIRFVRIVYTLSDYIRIDAVTISSLNNFVLFPGRTYYAIPIGGRKGQALVKLNNDHYQTTWADCKPYYAKYNLDDFEDILDEHELGRPVICKYQLNADTTLYLQLSKIDQNEIYFTGFDNTTMYIISVDDDDDWYITTKEI